MIMLLFGKDPVTILSLKTRLLVVEKQTYWQNIRKRTEIIRLANWAIILAKIPGSIFSHMEEVISQRKTNVAMVSVSLFATSECSYKCAQPLNHSDTLSAYHTLQLAFFFCIKREKKKKWRRKRGKRHWSEEEEVS